MRLSRITAALALLAVAAAMTLGPGSVVASTPAVPSYNHIFVVIEENHEYSQIIGNPAAPTINQLAQSYGLATNYFGITHPSEPNYVAFIGGNYFGIADDNPYYLPGHFLNQPSLPQQLDAAGLSWKGYFQALPHPGYLAICFPWCNGTPDRDALYVSKHVGIVNFAPVQTNPSDRQKMVPDTQLNQDLQSGQLPRFGLIIPTECADMHGSPPQCVDSGPTGQVMDNQLLTAGDQYVATVVAKITGSPEWSNGNNAIVITWDEGGTNLGCCDASPGGGRVATIVITSHGPRGLTDSNLYNHYSLLQTIQLAFGLGCLQFTCDTKNVKPLAPLFAAHS
jgi:phospholipase C